MIPKIFKIQKAEYNNTTVFILENVKDLNKIKLSKDETNFIKKQKEDKSDFITLNKLDKWYYFYFIKTDKNTNKITEEARRTGSKLQASLNKYKIESIIINDYINKPELSLAFAEGLALSCYRFNKYKTGKNDKEQITLKKIFIYSEKLKNSETDELNILTESVFKCRDMINEPVSALNSINFPKIVQNLSKNGGFSLEILNKQKIEALKMGGLLGVNKGSIDPPVFLILNWTPSKAINKKTYLLVGKGIMFDTGGINIKTGKSMEDMKCDMSGAAAVVSSIYAISKAKLPVSVIGLIPITDNRLNGNSLVPGDVITMHNGITVEVMNTDAEGRLILADALSYAKKFKPELVIDIATLTGSASIAIGIYGIVGMHNKEADNEFYKLQTSGEKVFERVVEFPFWDEYAESIKSQVADLKNIGERDAGMITAGKFLEKFTDYPYIHLDIAGPAFIDKNFNYWGLQATGITVRLLYDFFATKTTKQ